MTHTVATMSISLAAYNEIKLKLVDAGYGHALLEEGLLDMTGIALLPNVISAEDIVEVTIKEGYELRYIVRHKRVAGGVKKMPPVLQQCIVSADGVTKSWEDIPNYLEPVDNG